MHPARQFRWASAADGDVLADIMFDAVRNGESLYSEQQRAAWVPERRSGEDWIQRLRGQDFIVAEQDGKAVGFASLAQGGYVDFAYIRPEAQHSGLFQELLSRIIERALERREPLLWTHASLMAEPAFAKLGFTIRQRERVRIGDRLFDRCEMEMPLARDVRRSFGHAMLQSGLPSPSRGMRRAGALDSWLRTEWRDPARLPQVPDVDHLLDRLAAAGFAGGPFLEAVDDQPLRPARWDQ
jgi:putative acetyltransferase